MTDDTPQPIKARKTRRTESQWRVLVEQWQSSELTIDIFCEQQNLSYQSFCSWKKRFSKDDTVSNSPPVFIDLTNEEVSSSSAWHIVLKLDNGMELQLTRN